ncbi:MAG: hypothetical protein IOC42_01000 [Methylobacterium sp.]|nr:hypothetical protein [Methylobacterium sp.]MCA3668469.1 hypothetical protein [Methylobacterium sp.]MCA3675491.1 hypothetical protein [Methylobacterium sp.]
MLVEHFSRLAVQMVNCETATAREYWRRKLGFAEPIVLDPRPLDEAVAAHEAALPGNSPRATLQLVYERRA